MGTYYHHGASRKDIIRELTSPFGGEKDGKRWMVKTLRHTCVGNVLWSLKETTKPDGTVETWIACDLLKNDGGCGWGYKPMEEAMGPFYYTCPIAYLDKATSGVNEEWRSIVRARADRKKSIGKLFRSLSIGDRVRLVPSVGWVEVVGLKPARGRDARGVVWTFARKHVQWPQEEQADARLATGTCP